MDKTIGEYDLARLETVVFGGGKVEALGRELSRCGARRALIVTGFEKHGIKQLGFWTVAIGESNNDLFLILPWGSLTEREQKFGAFLKDPEWLEARRKSEEDGPVEATISNPILVPTAFSTVR
jgi:hypothetical protein